MPELPEVELVRRRMQAMAGLTIEEATVYDDAILHGMTRTALRRALRGRTIMDVRRRGKQIMCILDDSSVFAVHLGMTGDVDLGDNGVDHRHLRFSIKLSNGSGMHFIDQRKFGAIGHFRTEEEMLMAKALGPDALAISPGEFTERVSSHHKAIKTTLLDQGVLAGVGNLYSDEMLFQCRIHPEAKADTLTSRQLRCLHRAMQDILHWSIDNGSDFDRLEQRYLLRARRTGGECPRCGTVWTTISVNGRTAFLCPKCQRATNPGLSENR